MGRIIKIQEEYLEVEITFVMGSPRIKPLFPASKQGHTDLYWLHTPQETSYLDLRAGHEWDEDPYRNDKTSCALIITIPGFAHERENESYSSMT